MCPKDGSSLDLDPDPMDLMDLDLDLNPIHPSLTLPVLELAFCNRTAAAIHIVSQTSTKIVVRIFE